MENTIIQTEILGEPHIQTRHHTFSDGVVHSSSSLHDVVDIKQTFKTIKRDDGSEFSVTTFEAYDSDGNYSELRLFHK